MSDPEAAARAFGLGHSPELIAERENLTYRSGDWALRCHRVGYNSDVEIRSELAWLQVLSESGVDVPRPRAAGNSLVLVSGGSLWSCLSWEGGVHMARVSTADTFARLGQALARLHDASDAWARPDWFMRRSWDAEGLIGPDPVWGRFWENPFLTGAERDILTAFRGAAAELLGTADLDCGLIHADANGENVLVSDRRLTLIDFDDGGFGYRLFDLATPAQWHRMGDAADGLTDALVDGYLATRDIDLTHFPLIRLLRAATYLGWIVPRIDEPGGRQRFAACREQTLPRIRTWLDRL